MVIELRVVQFWSEIILVISNRTRAARSFDFEITRMISDQIALHSVQLPLCITYHHYVSIYNQHDYHHLQGEGNHSSASPQLSEYNPLFLLEYQLRLIKIVI